MNSDHPYRNQNDVVIDPRWEAETQLIQARTQVLNQIARGISIANALAKSGDESSDMYKRRIQALSELANRLR